MEASRRAADESSTQPQQRPSNQQKAASGTTHTRLTGASLLDADPLQSIANLLNHHSALKQQQRNWTKVASEVSALAEQQQVDQVTARTGDSKAPARPKKTTGGVSGQLAAVTSRDQSAKLQLLKQTDALQAQLKQQQQQQREFEEAGQVDQGNSYLYAYNDFLKTNTNARAGSSLLQGAEAASPAAPTNSKLARQAQRPQQEPQNEHTLPPPAAAKNFFLPTKHRALAAATVKQKLQLASSNQSQTSDHKSPLARSKREGRSGTSKLLTRLQVGGGAEKEAPQGESLAQLAEGEVFVTSAYEAELCGREGGEEFEEHEEAEVEEQELEDEVEEEDDTLSYIFNRHNLFLAQQQQQQQQQNNQQRRLHKHTHLCATHLQADCAPICNQLCQSHPTLTTRILKQPETGAAENPNHLRQYLQIEENFNSYKAAKRRLHPDGVALEPLGTLAEQPPAGIIELPPGGAAAPSGLNTGSNLHLPLANYMIATNELAEGHEFGYQTQLTQTRPLASGATDYLHSVGMHQHSPNSSLESQSTLQHARRAQNYTMATGQHSNHNLALLNQHAQQQQQQQQQRQDTRSYLQLLRFVRPKSLIGGSSKGKMYSAGGEQAASQQLAGQAGAYYVTSHTAATHQPAGASSSSSSEANLGDNLISQSSQHCSHHQQARLLAAHQHQHSAMQQQPGHARHLHHQHQNHAHYHHHHHHQQQQQAMLGAGYANYPPLTSSDSSLGSSGAFASSAVRATSGWLRDFCSKKCLFITCLMLILFILVLVISLSAYLNFLIASSKTNLQPLSGRLRVDLVPGELLRNITDPPTLEQLATRLFANKSSPEFLEKQRDFETIIRGAMDRTQPPFKTYPNHLVKLEVYAIRSATTPIAASATSSLASLWVYFRLFLNKRKLQQDQQLMRRKSADEPLERQFLPRLTQQTLQSGFEQLLASTPTGATNNRLLVEIIAPNETGAGSTSAALQGINSRRFGVAGHQTQIDSTQAPANRRLNTRATTTRNNQAPKHQLKSFDEQINRLMYLIEAIDLQSILVTSEFDMMQSMGQPAASEPPRSMSDGLRASAPLNANQPTTTTMATPANSKQAELASVMVASGTSVAKPALNGKPQDEDDNSAKLDKSTSTGGKERADDGRQPPIRPPLEDEPAAASSTAQPTSKFTLQQGYMENATRPSPPAASSSGATGKPASVFLPNLSPKRVLQTSSTRSPPTSSRAPSSTQVVPLVSGQPVISQSGQLLGDRQRASGSTSSSTTQRTPTTTTSRPASSPSSGSLPTGRPALSSTTSGRSPQIVATTSIEELWTNSLNSNASSNLTSTPDSNGHLISVTTIGNTEGQQRAAPSTARWPQSQPAEWHKISVLSDDITDTIRTQLDSSSTSTARPPKVAPAANIAGSLMAPQTPMASSTAQQNNAPQRQRAPAQAANQVQKRPQDSAVILSGEFAPNQANPANSTSSRTASPTPRPKAKKAKHSNANQPARGSTLPNDRQQARNGTASAAANKPHGKPKAKKVTSTVPGDTLRNQTRPMQVAGAPAQQQQFNASAVAPLDGKGIPIVDNFLASIGGAGRVREQPTSTPPSSLTTIELSRSTTALTPVSSTGADQSPGAASETQASSSGGSAGEFVVSNQQARPGTTSFSGQWRPIASNSNSNQPRSPSTDHDERQPASDDFWASARNRSHAPNLSLIVATERLPESLARASGSQSPFAMPNQLMVASLSRPGNSENGRFANRFPATSAQTRGAAPQNEFESHRVSRMRQSQAHSHRSSESADPLAGLTTTTSSTSTSSTSSSTSSSTTTTSSSLNLMDGANSRIVDDFLITTDRNDRNNGRSSTLLPPLVLSALHEPSSAGNGGQHSAGLAPMGSLPMSALVQAPKRTRGPFAFETLRSLSFAEVPLATQTLSPRSGDLAPSSSSSTFDPLDEFEPTASSARAERALEQQHVDDKLLARKRLFQSTSSADQGDLSSAFVANAGVASESSLEASIVSADEQLATPPNEVREFGNRRRPRNFAWKAGSLRAGPSLECEHHSCRARDSGEPVCLNKTQICDDFLDCQDESDELDCVALLKLEPHTKRMSFSNGAGIIYLNRRGSLAPMCVDYYHPKLEQAANSASEHSSTSLAHNRIRREQTSSAHELEALQLQEAIKRQSELIRQVNTIGQYACSLQSFSRLASVKINHNDQVDGLHLISSSPVFHKLSVSASSGLDASDSPDSPLRRAFNGSESFRSSGQFEVELSSSDECPSQRTVFVKCGGFQCGQNAILLEHRREFSPNNQDNNPSSDKRKLAASDGVVINDFPWLVKLYRHKALSCHGHLIDESWLIAPADCFVNNRTTANNNNNNNNNDHDEPSLSTSSSGWTAEISHEHHGKSGAAEEPLARRIKEILRQPAGRVREGNEEAAGAGVEVDERDRRESPAIVLAKLDRPVRFRPICLPSSASGHADGQDKLASTTELRDCISLNLPSNWTAVSATTTTHSDDSNLESVSSSNNLTPTQRQQQQKHSAKSQEELLLNKVNLLEVSDCLDGEFGANNSNNLLCADEISPSTVSQPQAADQLHSASPNEDTPKTRVLICSQPDAQSPLRSKWTLVGVETSFGRPLGATPHSTGGQQSGRRLFAKISSQIDWIVDTMNPLTELNTGKTPGEFANPRRHSETSAANSLPARAGGSLATSPGERLRLANAASRKSNNEPQEATCSQFRCSTGECLSWSRICDGLYDCSSHEDEKDCHK